MAISGPPRTGFGLFGGPGFIVALLVVLAGGIFLAVQTIGGRSPGSGARLSLPGEVTNIAPTPIPAAPKPSSGADGASDAASAALQSMPPLAQGAATSAAPEPAPLPALDVAWSPAELLEEFPPEASLALPDGAARDDARAYRRASSVPATTKRLALVAVGLGPDPAATARAIVGTPGEVSLSFMPGSGDLAEWIDAARAYGHEALIDLYLGGTADMDARADDRILLAELGAEENMRRLDAILAEAPAIAGVTIHVADSFLGDAAALTPILERLQSRGLIVVGLPVTAPLTVGADRVLDGAVTSRDTLDLKALARQRGAALVLATAENALQLARNWARPDADLRGEFPLVPASALVED